MAARYELDPAALAALVNSPSGPVAKDLIRRANLVVNVAKAKCPVASGRLRASITYQILSEGGTLTARVGTNVIYGLYQEMGTGIYGPMNRPITPRNAKVLVFTPKGATKPVFARSVKGVKPRHFLRDTLPAGAG